MGGCTTRGPRGCGCGRGRTKVASSGVARDDCACDAAPRGAKMGICCGAPRGAMTSFLGRTGIWTADREGDDFGVETANTTLQITKTTTGDKRIAFIPNRIRRSVDDSCARRRRRGSSPYVGAAKESFSRRRSGVRCWSACAKGASNRGVEGDFMVDMDAEGIDEECNNLSNSTLVS